MSATQTSASAPAAVPPEPTPSPLVDDRPDRRDWLVRGTLAALLAAVAALYMWGLSASGYANSFYSAAAQAGSQNATAWFFGSLDAGNSITVDKPPAAIWLMALSVRLFGLSSWSILLPEAALGVASVGVLYATVRRSLLNWRGTNNPDFTRRNAHWAALAGGAVFALTPVATLMFRFNNPDALLVFSLVLASYFTVRAMEHGGRGWLALAGVAVGLGFLTKMLQAFLVLPALVVAYALAAPASWRKKLVDLTVACIAMVASFGWYLAAVQFTPASMRPYIGGSQNNSILELLWSYNGLGRITGNETGSVGGGGGTGWGETGITRVFDGVSGGMVSWLIPAALALSVAAIVVAVRQSRATPPDVPQVPSSARALLGGSVIWLGWLVVTVGIFSFMAGIYHDYYTVALAPAIGGAVAMGAAALWTRRAEGWARIVLGLTSIATGVWALALLTQAGGGYLWLGWAAFITGTGAGLAMLWVDRLPRLIAAGVVVAALGAGLVGPLAYSLNTAATAHTGSIVTAGPVSGKGGPGGRGGPNARGGRPGGPPPNTNGQMTGRTAPGAAMGGLLNGTSVSNRVLALLTANSSDFTWVAATLGSQNAASYQLASGDAVMAIGGFNGSDPSPTLAQFQAQVAAKQIHYYIAGESGAGRGGSSNATQIAEWVTTHFTAQTVDGVTLYDLTEN